jgi:hypothetical protein
VGYNANNEAVEVGYSGSIGNTVAISGSVNSYSVTLSAGSQIDRVEVYTPYSFSVGVMRLLENGYYIQNNYINASALVHNDTGSTQSVTMTVNGYDASGTLVRTSSTTANVASKSVSRISRNSVSATNVHRVEILVDGNFTEIINVPFNLSETRVQVPVGSSKTITATPLRGMTFVTEPYVNVTKGKNPVDIKKVGDNTFEITIKGEVEEETEIEVFAACAKEAEGVPGVPVDVPDPDNRTIVANATNPGATVLITGKFSYYDPEASDPTNKYVPLKNHPICVSGDSSPGKTEYAYGMTDADGKLIPVAISADITSVTFSIPAVYRKDGDCFGEGYNNVYYVGTGIIRQDVSYDPNNIQPYRHTISVVERKQVGSEWKYQIFSHSINNKVEDLKDISKPIDMQIDAKNNANIPFVALDTLIEGRKYWTNNVTNDLPNLRVYFGTSGNIEEGAKSDNGNSWASSRRDSDNKVIRSIIHLGFLGNLSKKTYLHELGHCIMRNYSRDGGPGGSHGIFQHFSNEFAYSEGWANFYAHAAYNAGKGQAKIGGSDISTPEIYMGKLYGKEDLKPKPDPKNPNTTVYNEYASAAIFWDILNYYKGNINDVAKIMKETGTPYINKTGNPNMFDFYERIPATDKYSIWWEVFSKNTDRYLDANDQGYMDMKPPYDVQVNQIGSQNGNIIPFEVTARDDTGIGRVDFYEKWDGAIKFHGSVTEAPFKFNFDTTDTLSVIREDSIMMVRVYDLAGNEVTIPTKAKEEVSFKNGEDAAKNAYTERKKLPYTEGWTPFTIKKVAPNSSVPAVDENIKTAMQNKGIRVETIGSGNDINQDIYKNRAVLLTNEITSNTDILQDYVNEGGILFATAEAGSFLGEEFADIFSATAITSEVPLTTNDKGLMAVIDGSVLDGITLSTTATGFLENTKLQAIACQGEAVVCAAADYGYGRIIYIPFDPDATSNQLLDYAIDVAVTDNIRGRVEVAFSSRDQILQDSYPLTLEAGTSKTYAITKGQDDLYIANEQYVPELKLEVFSPDDSVYELESEMMYPYMDNLSGEAGTWTVRISNEGDRTLTTALFVSQPVHEIYFDDLDIANDGYLYTNKRAFALSGTSDAYNSFSLTIEHEEDSTTRTVPIVNGEFSQAIQLELGISKLEINATDDVGNELSRSLWIDYDTEAPILEVVSSQDIAYLDDYTLILSASESCIVTVNDEECEDISSGTPVYAFDTALETGNNVFNVVATDYAGNRTTLRVTIVRSEKTMEGNNPEIVGFSIRENAVISEDTVVYAFIQEESDYILRAWLDDKEMAVDGFMIDLNLKGIKSGRHSLICYAQDEWGNSTQVAISLIVEKEVEDGVFVSGKIKSYNPNKPITVRLMNAENEIAYTETFEGSGGYGLEEQEFSIPDVAPGTYDLVIIKDAHTKLTVKNVTVSNEDVDLTKDIRPEIQLMSLRCGDINGDGLINDADLTILWRAGNYNRKADEAENSWCDLNGDGLINDADLTILWLAYNYNRGAINIE